MNDAPERIWAQDAEPSECSYIGGGWWDDECENTQHPHIVEYVRADTITALEDENRRMRDILRRYRQETPLGHQPHMIAHEVDAILGVTQT